MFISFRAHRRWGIWKISLPDGGENTGVYRVKKAPKKKKEKKLPLDERDRRRKRYTASVNEDACHKPPTNKPFGQYPRDNTFSCAKRLLRKAFAEHAGEKPNKISFVFRVLLFIIIIIMMKNCRLLLRALRSTSPPANVWRTDETIFYRSNSVAAAEKFY